MWKQKIGISLSKEYAIPTTKVIKLIKQIGFDAICPIWAADVDMEEIAATATECGLFMQSLHAPFGKAADMWSVDKAVSAPAKEDILRALYDCARFQIPVLVVHPWIGFHYSFDENALYFENFDEVVEYAKRNRIQIAFENTEGEEYLFALMEHYKSEDTVGFCWDSGHELCYNHAQDLLAKYGDRLIMTHLNDNLGIRQYDGTISSKDDLHLLPYDGIADWDDAVVRLKRSKKLDCLNFELKIVSKPNRHENDIYQQMPYEMYFAEAYKRACKIAYKYAK